MARGHSHEDDAELIKLCWKLLEYKVAYYRPEKVHPSRTKDVVIDDEAYDAMELRYLELLVKIYGRKPQFNTIVHKVYPGYEDMVSDAAMMEVDESRPSVKLVMAKLGSMEH